MKEMHQLDYLHKFLHHHWSSKCLLKSVMIEGVSLGGSSKWIFGMLAWSLSLSATWILMFNLNFPSQDVSDVSDYVSETLDSYQIHWFYGL